MKSSNQQQNVPLGKRTFGGLANNANIPNPMGSKDLPAKRSHDEQQQQQQENKENGKVLWDDLDAEDADDPLMVAEYVGDIIKYMRQLEVLPSVLIVVGLYCSHAELHGLPKGDQLEYAEYFD